MYIHTTFQKKDTRLLEQNIFPDISHEKSYRCETKSHQRGDTKHSSAVKFSGLKPKRQERDNLHTRERLVTVCVLQAGKHSHSWDDNILRAWERPRKWGKEWRNRMLNPRLRTWKSESPISSPLPSSIQTVRSVWVYRQSTWLKKIRERLSSLSKTQACN